MNSEINIPLPRLLNSSGRVSRQIHPTSVSINLAIEPLSDATMILPQGESVPARGYVELFTVMGSAGIFRVRSPQDAYGVVTTTAELEHAIVEVGDYLVKSDISEMMSASTAFTTIFGHYGGSKWQLGSVSALGSTSIAVEVNHGRVLDALLSVMAQKPECMLSFDFSTSPWTLSVVARGTTVSAEGRLARNVNYARVTYDDTELCTRVYYEKASTTDSTAGIDTSDIPAFDASKNFNKGAYVLYSSKIYLLPNGHTAGVTWANTTKTLKNDIPTTTWVHIDADTLSTYGVIEKSISIDTNYSDSEAQKVAQEYLKRHKEPRVSVEISALELSHITGESFDSFDIGKLYRLALSDYNVTVEKNVTRLSFPSVYGTPEKIIVNLADEEDTAINFLHDIDAKGGTDGGSGGINDVAGGNGKDHFYRITDHWTKLEQDAYHFNLVASRVNEANNILQQAGMYIDADGVVVYAKDNANNIGAIIQVDSDKISQIVTNVGADGTVTSASIVASINRTTGQGEVHIDADHVYINAGASGEQNIVTEIGGKLVASDITANLIQSKINQLAVLYAGSIDTGSIDVEGTVDCATVEAGNVISDSLNGYSTDDIVVDASVSGSTLTLTKGDGSQVTVNFSGATSLSGSWSGTTYTVTASPQGYTQSTTIALDLTGSANIIGASVKEGNTVITSSGARLEEDVSNKKVTCTLTGGSLSQIAEVSTASTYSAGANSVTLSQGSWSNGVLTVTASNSATTNVSIPASSGTEWTNTEDDKWRATLTIGGATRNSTVKDFSSIRTAGANSVTLSQGSWSEGVLTVTASNGATSNVSIPASSGTTWTNTENDKWRATLTIGGVTRNSTVKDFSSIRTAGANSVTLSQGSWDSGALVVTASNSKTTTVSLPSVSATTWQDRGSNKWRTRLTIGGAYRYSSEKDFSSLLTAQYNAGYNQACTDAGITGTSGVVYTAAGWYNTLYQYPDSSHVVPVYNCATGASSHQLTKK